MSAGRTYRFRHIDGAGRRSHTGPVLARVRSATLSGVEAATIFVEVDVTPGLPSFSTVGLPDATVRESRDRVRAAIRNAGLEFPIERITEAGLIGVGGVPHPGEISLARGFSYVSSSSPGGISTSRSPLCPSPAHRRRPRRALRHHPRGPEASLGLEPARGTSP